VKKAPIVLVLLVLCGCGATRISTSYREPARANDVANSKIIDLAFDDAWAKMIPRIGSTFFSVNNIDKASGFMNVSYSGDPLKYVDCGVQTYTLTRFGQANSGSFPAASAYGEEVFHTGLDVSTVVASKMALEGRANIILERLSAAKTKVTVNVIYVVSRNVSVLSGMSELPPPQTDTVSFSTNSVGNIPSRAWIGHPWVCVANHRLEGDILDLI
jgi:hypothetical protein